MGHIGHRENENPAEQERQWQERWAAFWPWAARRRVELAAGTRRTTADTGRQGMLFDSRAGRKGNVHG